MIGNIKLNSYGKQENGKIHRKEWISRFLVSVDAWKRISKLIYFNRKN